MKKTTSVDEILEAHNLFTDVDKFRNAKDEDEASWVPALKAQLLTLIEEAMPDSEIDLIKFERDKTGWIEEVGVDADTLTDKDLIAIYRLARHFKQQAIEDTLGNIRKVFK